MPAEGRTDGGLPALSTEIHRGSEQKFFWLNQADVLMTCNITDLQKVQVWSPESLVQFWEG